MSSQLGLSWERFLLELRRRMSISLKCCLKYCNVEEHNKRPTFVLTAFDPEIGFLTSEGYPYSYARNADVNSPTYPIPEGWSINIYFQEFDVEESPDCRLVICTCGYRVYQCI